MIPASSSSEHWDQNQHSLFLKSFTRRAISYIQGKWGVCSFFPAAAALTAWTIKYNSNVVDFFFSGPIFFRLRRSVVAADGVHHLASRNAGPEQRLEQAETRTLHYPLHISPSLQFRRKFASFSVKCFNSTRILHSAQSHKLKFTIQLHNYRVL